MRWIRPKLIHCFSIFVSFLISFLPFSASHQMSPTPTSDHTWHIVSKKPEMEYKERKGKEGRKGMREAIRNILQPCCFFFQGELWLKHMHLMTAFRLLGPIWGRVHILESLCWVWQIGGGEQQRPRDSFRVITAVLRLFHLITSFPEWNSLYDCIMPTSSPML